MVSGGGRREPSAPPACHLRWRRGAELCGCHPCRQFRPAPYLALDDSLWAGRCGTRTVAFYDEDVSVRQGINDARMHQPRRHRLNLQSPVTVASPPASSLSPLGRSWAAADSFEAPAGRDLTRIAAWDHRLGRRRRLARPGCRALARLEALHKSQAVSGRGVTNLSLPSNRWRRPSGAESSPSRRAKSPPARPRSRRRGCELRHSRAKAVQRLPRA